MEVLQRSLLTQFIQFQKLFYNPLNSFFNSKQRILFPYQQKSQTDMKNKTNKNNKNRKIPLQLQFQPPVFDFSRFKHNQKQQIPQELEISQIEGENAFTAEDRQSLKNAFRYICRLIFKQAPKYKDKIKQIAQQNDFKIKNDTEFNQLFEKAEQISGERYFRKFMNNFDIPQQRTICLYMRWFLIYKYLRYISEQGKGKRKKMKKHLYIKFKNQVMLPYIQSLL